MLDPFKGVLGLDLETSSAFEIKNGAWAYSQHPSTIVYVACFYYAERAGVYDKRVWFPGDRLPKDIVEFITGGGTLIAHNASFERAIWANILGPNCEWPDTDPDQWCDTQILGLAINLPMSLGGLAKALGCPIQKDTDGAKLMRAMAVAKSDGEDGWIYDRDPEHLRTLTRYCGDDVGSMMDSYFRLPPLSVDAARLVRVDRRINDRGIYLDREFAAKCAELKTERAAELAGEAFAASGCWLPNSTSAPALKRWLKMHGVKLPKVAKKNSKGVMVVSETADRTAVLTMLERDDLPEAPRAVLQNRLEANKVTSLAKLDRVPLMVGTDGRLRHALQVFGAHTDRWTSSGLQVHNLPKENRGPGERDLVRAAIMYGGLDGLKLATDRPLDAISQCLRSIIAAPKGRDLLAADYNAIEARVVAWLSGQTDILQQFADGTDVYTYTAANVGSDSRQLGKVMVLALGYGMGVLKFVVTAAKWGIILTRKEARELQIGWRAANSDIVQFWADLDEAARDAVMSPGRVFPVGPFIRMHVRDNCLHAELPSGRAIRYWRPHFKRTMRKFEIVKEDGNVETFEREVDELRFFTIGKDKSSMVSESTYGGKLCVDGSALVLTDRGWVPLRDVRASDRVHDGVEFVGHDGTVYKSVQPCVEVSGVWMTPEHEVLTDGGWRPASSSPEPYRPDLPSVGTTPLLPGQVLAARRMPRARVVYDILNCGLRRRFVVLGEHGPFVVHNCENVTQAVARDLLGEACVRIDPVEPYDLVVHVHDSLCAEVPEGEGSVDDFCRMLEESPSWAVGLPVHAEGYRSKHFAG